MSTVKRVLVLDSTIREGEQTPGVSFTPEEKLRLCSALDRAGVDAIELGHPGAAPDIDRAIALIADAGLGAELVVHCRTHPADIRRAAGLPVGRLALFLGTSPSHLEGKLRISRGEALRRVGETVATAVASGKRVRFSAEDAFRTDPGFLTEVVAAAAAAGADHIGLPDTVGVARPRTVCQVFSRVAQAVPGVTLNAHCHDDLGLAVANTLAAVAGGATCVHLTVNGLGERCGLAAMAPVVMALRLLDGVHTVDPAALVGLSSMVEQMSGVPVSPLAPVVGRHAFSHTGGVHTAGVTRQPDCYEPYPPELTSRHREVLVGKLAGRAAVTWRLARLGVRVEPAQIDRLVEAVKEAGRPSLDDGELLTLATTSKGSNRANV